jgi:hypothetical protein
MGCDGGCIKSTLTNASEQVVHALNNTTTRFTLHPSTLAAPGLPIAAVFGFVPGLMTFSSFIFMLVKPSLPSLFGGHLVGFINNIIGRIVLAI